MTGPNNLAHMVSQLEDKVRKLEMAVLVMLNLIMCVYLFSR